MLRTNLPPRPLWCGLEYGPALVVVAPAETRPRELPAAWTPLADSFQIAWCATPGPDTGPDTVEDVLETLADRRVRTHFVVDAALAGFAAGALGDYAHLVRQLVVVGPEDPPEIPGVRVRRVRAGGLGSPRVVASVLAELGLERG